MKIAAPVRIVTSPATNVTGVYTPAMFTTGAAVNIAGVLLASIFKVKCDSSNDNELSGL
jgi:hypothetical protein